MQALKSEIRNPKVGPRLALVSHFELLISDLFRISHFAFCIFLSFVFSLLLAASAAADPHADYMLHCQGCHGPDGSGAPGAVPNFHGQVAKFLLVPGGREYLIRVPGVSQSELSDARVAEVLNWIVSELDGGGRPHGSAPFTAEEVGRRRRPPLADVDVVRAGLMHAIDQDTKPRSKFGVAR